jgi:hypothetical protein
MRQLIIGSSIWLLMTLGWVSLSSVMAADDPRSQTAEVEQTKSQAVQVLDDRNTNDHNLIAKIIVVAVMCLFLPLNTLTYYLFRRYRRRFEVERILEILPLYPKYEAYLKAYRDETSGRYFLWSVSYALVVSCLGLMLLFLSGAFFLPSEFPSIVLDPSEPNIRFPAAGSRLIAGMAFLGAYIWGVQYILRRYALNDLVPDVYYNFAMRMILSALIAVVLYNAYSAIVDNSGPGLTSKVWPVLALMIGMFPQRGLRWLTERLPLISPESSDAVRDAPLEMIEGIESQDKLRLAELGIDTCYDLAVVDFLPLVLNTPYGARQLIDWILQAKLCVYCSHSMKELRPLGIRTILDLACLNGQDFQALAKDTGVTESALQRAQIAMQNSDEIKRLERVGQLLGQFTKD